MTPRRILAASLALAVALSLLSATHYYLARRLVLDAGIAEPLRSVLLVAIGGLAALLILGMVSGRVLPRRWSRVLSLPAMLWMGFLFLFMVALLASDVLLALAAGVAQAAGTTDGTGEVGGAPRAAGIAALVGTAGLYAVASALRVPGVKRVEVWLSRWPAALDGFRIVQISDVHIGSLLGRRFAEDVVDRCNTLAPDLLAVTGDLVDGDVDWLREEVAPFANLRARHGVYFVTGNHDHYSGVDPWVERIRELGIRVLRNERVRIGEGDAGFDLAGVDDHRGGFGPSAGEDLPRALEGRDPDRALVLLAHDPSSFVAASETDVDLQLSGHTHGGQIWPFRYLVRLAVPFVAGLYARNGSQLYVSRGTGFWGPPMRLFAPSEITELTLRSASG